MLRSTSSLSYRSNETKHDEMNRNACVLPNTQQEKLSLKEHNMNLNNEAPSSENIKIILFISLTSNDG